MFFPSPDAPQLLSVKAVSRHHHSINLSWEQSIDTPVTGYIIAYRSPNEAWEEIKISGGKRNSYLIENLRCGSKYQLTVTAYNKIGKSTPTELISVSTAGDGEYISICFVYFHSLLFSLSLLFFFLIFTNENYYSARVARILS